MNHGYCKVLEPTQIYFKHPTLEATGGKQFLPAMFTVSQIKYEISVAGYVTEM